MNAPDLIINVVKVSFIGAGALVAVAFVSAIIDSLQSRFIFPKIEPTQASEKNKRLRVLQPKE